MAKEAISSSRRIVKSQSSLSSVMSIARGLLASVAVTVLGVVVFALLIKWMSLQDTAISILNQALKLIAIFIGARASIGRGGTGGVLKGAILGVLYMMLGVVGYAFLSGLSLPPTAYLADLGMGVAAGGLCGVILSNLPAKKR